MGWISNWIFIWRTQGSGGLVTEYSFGVCRDPADCWPNIHLVNAGIQRITHWIFIWCMQGSGGFPTEYSFSVYRVQADYRLNIQLVYAGVWWITDQIFIWCMQGSSGFPTKYSVGVCRDPADFPTEYSFSVWMGQADCQLNIQLVCAGIQWITDQIFIWCMHKQITNWIFIDCSRIEYLVVGMIGLGGLELNIQWSEWSD